MTRTTFAVAGVYALASAALFAQTTTPQPSPAQPTPATAAMTLTGCLKPWDASTMGPPQGAAMPSPGTPSGTTSAAFVLTNAEHTAAKTPGVTLPGAPAPPMSGSTAPGGAHASYLLQAQSGMVDLAGHVNEKVEVMGAVATDLAQWFRGGAAPGTPGAPTTPGMTPAATPPGASTPTTSSGGTPTTSTGGTPTTSATSPAGTSTAARSASMPQQAGAAAAQSTFMVTSIKTIAKTCS